MAASLLPPNLVGSVLSYSLLLLALTWTSTSSAEDVAEEQRVLVPYGIAGNGNSFQPSFKPFLPRILAMKRSLAIGRLQFRPGKRSVGDDENSQVADNSDLMGFIKRSAALGRIGFRPGKRSWSLLANPLTEDEEGNLVFLTEDQMGKRSDDADDSKTLQKRSMAVGRTRFRPGKRSIATGRTGFRPGKRSEDAMVVDENL